MTKINIFLDGSGNIAGHVEDERTHIRRVFDFTCDSENKNRKEHNIRGVKIFETTCVKDGITSKSFYIEGISNKFHQAIGTGVYNRSKIALDFISKIYDPGDEITISAFSRGAASAVLLANYIKYVGIEGLQKNNNKAGFDLDKNKKDTLVDQTFDELFSNRSAYDKFYQEKKFTDYKSPVKSLFLIDTVFSTIEIGKTLFLIDTIFSAIEIGKTKKAWIFSAIGLAENVIHTVASDENRNSFFPVILIDNYVKSGKEAYEALRQKIAKSIYPYGKGTKIQTFVVKGSHSDIAGSNKGTNLGYPVLELLIKEMRNNGIPINEERADNALKKWRSLPIIINLESKSGSLKYLWRVMKLENRDLTGHARKAALKKL